MASLGDLASDPASPAAILVTHHVEEIPIGFEHIAMMSGGKVVAAGPIDSVMSSESLSSCFGQSLRLEQDSDRYRAWMPR